MNLLEYARIPPLYRDADLKSVDSKPIRAYAMSLKINLGTGVGLLLMGPNGTGKTYAACALAMHSFHVTTRVLFLTCADLVDGLKPNAPPFSEDLTMLEALQSRALLVVDDLGKEYRSGSGFSEQAVDNLLRYRLAHRNATVFTTNLALGQLQEIYGASFGSLLSQACIFVKFDGPDRRKDDDVRRARAAASGIVPKK